MRTVSRLGLIPKYFRGAMVGLVVGFSLAFVLGCFVWLEMRVNTGHIIPVSVALFALLAAMRRRSVGLGPFILLELLGAFLLLAIYGFDLATILTVPAAFFRDAFHLSSLTLKGIDILLLCLLGTGNVLWVGAVVIRWKRMTTGRYRGCGPDVQ